MDLTSTQGYTQTDPEPSPEVHAQLETLAMNTKALQELSDELRSRLAPVLGPDVPRPMEGEMLNAVRRESSPVADRLMQSNDGLQSLQSHLRESIRRLEI